MSVNLFNSTPFDLEIDVFSPDGNLKAKFQLNPVNGRSLPILRDNIQLERPLLKITAKDSLGKVMKSVEFCTQYNHSWIISDTEIRRQWHGSQLHIPDSYSDKEKESYFCQQPDYKRKHCSKIKQYSWNPVGGCPCLCIGSIVTCHPAFKMAVNSVALATRRSGDTQTNKTINIFNDSPYYLDISMEDRSSSRMYWNDPESNRITQMQTNDDCPRITVTACDSIGQKVKSATFYTRNDFSWVVTDECILRHKPGAALYVPEPYNASQILSECIRDRCNEAIRYDWLIDTGRDFALRRVDEPDHSNLMIGSVEENQPSGDRVRDAVCFDMAHGSGFSTMSTKVQKAALELVEWIKLDKLHRGGPGTLHEQNKVRLDLQRIQKEPRPYTVFAIQSEKDHFATVFIHNSLMGSRDIKDEHLRVAFQMSLIESKEIWISVDSEGDMPPNGPPVGTAKMTFTQVLSVHVGNMKRVRIWTRDDKS